VKKLARSLEIPFDARQQPGREQAKCFDHLNVREEFGPGSQRDPHMHRDP